MEWVTTSTVLANLQDFHNHAAWDHFVSRFRLPVFRFARSIGLGESDAEDVAQETLATFAQSFRTGHYDRSKGRLSQWLFGIAYRKALDERRKGAKRYTAPSSSIAGNLDELVVDEAVTASWDQEWEQSLLEQCLDRVRNEVEPISYEAFERVVKQNQDAAQAAQELGVNIKVVYNAKHRILKRIRVLRAELENIV